MLQARQANRPLYTKPRPRQLTLFAPISRQAWIHPANQLALYDKLIAMLPTGNIDAHAATIFTFSH